MASKRFDPRVRVSVIAVEERPVDIEEYGSNARHGSSFRCSRRAALALLT
jgi:hypothetical protein